MAMLRTLVPFSVFFLIWLLAANGRIRWPRLARGFKRLQYNMLKRADPIRMLETSSSLTSVYVGGTGIWWRSGIIASISQMEQGEQEAAMETLNIAITTLAVFDTTQATVSPIASELINQLVKHKGKFPQTISELKKYNEALTKRMVNANADDVDDIIDNAKNLKKRIGEFFDSEVTAFMKNTQGYDDLVTSLKNAKKWARGLTWFDTISGPFFDAANVAFCGWQLYNAIHDENSSPEERSLNIASASLGVASGAVGVTAFVVGALATAGSTLAAVAGPIGAIIGCVLSLASIIIDLINSENPYGTIKNHLETIQKLKEGSLKYLQNQVNITHQVTPVFKYNTGFDTIYEINQGNLIQGMRGESVEHISGVDDDPNIIFDGKISPGRENGYLTKGKKRIFDKSKYPQNLFFRPQGLVPLGYDFYGNVTKPNRKGVTVVANTAMVAEHFWIRGVHIDTQVENDEETKYPVNVVIGEMTGLAKSTHSIRVKTGAGNDLLQVTGLICNIWTANRNCFAGALGTGINTLSFQGMNPDRVEFPTIEGTPPKIFAGVKYDMRERRTPFPEPGSTNIYLRLKESKQSEGVAEYKVGFVKGVSVFHGSPFDDEIWMGESKNCVVKNDGGNNNYVIYLSDERDFTHTIIEDSETLGQIYLVRKRYYGGGQYEQHKNDDFGFDEETKTVVTFMRDSRGKHKFTGRIIIRRSKPGNVAEMKLYLVEPKSLIKVQIRCKLRSLDIEELGCSSERSLQHYKRAFGSNINDRPVPSVPFHYRFNTDVEAHPIPGLCGDFIISLGDFLPAAVQKFSLLLPENSFIALDDEFMDEIGDWQAQRVLFYLKSKKKLVFEQRLGGLTKASRSVEVDVPQAKRFVFGTFGNYQLLLDLKHDDRQAVNLGSEYLGLVSRPADKYKFTEHYVDKSPKPKQLVFGVPSKKPTETKWNIKFGGAKTYAEVALEETLRNKGTTTGAYAENTLIVSDTLWFHLSREQNDMSIIFYPSVEGKNSWDIIVKKGKETIHQARVEGANMLAYHEGLVRSNLYDLGNGEKRSFNLYKVGRKKMEKIQRDIIGEAKMCG